MAKVSNSKAINFRQSLPSVLGVFGHASTGNGESLRNLHALLDELNDDNNREQHHWLVDSLWFNGIITGTVVLNTIQLGLEADYPNSKDIWRICENTVTGIFLVEMITKIVCLRCDYFHDKANLMDACLTLLGVLDCWVFAYIAGDVVDLQSMSILRVLRLFRLVRVAKVASKIRPLVLVLSGLYKALATTFWVFLVLIIVMYVFAVFCTEYIGRGDTSLYPGYATDETIIDGQEVMASFNPHLVFGSMSASMLTLFNIAIGGEWQEVVRPLAIKQPVFVLLFLSYCVVIVFGIMNVIIAIVVDNVILESKRIDDVLENALKQARRHLLEQVQRVIMGIDTNHDGVVDKHELKNAFRSHPELRELLEKCDLPAGWTHQEMLAMLDNSGDGVLQHEEFTTNLFRLLDGDEFQKICIVQASLNQLKQLIRQAHEKLEIQIAEVKQSIRHLRAIRHSSTDRASTVSNAEIKADTELDGAHGLFVDDDTESIPPGTYVDAPPRLSRSSGSKLQPSLDYLTIDRGPWWRDGDLGEGVEQPSAARKSNASAFEDQLCTQATAVCQELHQDIGSSPHKRIADIFDASILTMKTSFQMELALLMQGEVMSAVPQKAQRDMWNMKEELTGIKALLEAKIQEANQLLQEKASVQMAFDSYKERHALEMNEIADWKLMVDDLSKSHIDISKEAEDLDIRQEAEVASNHVARAPSSLSPLRSSLSLHDSAHKGALFKNIMSKSILSSDEDAHQSFPSRESTNAHTSSSSGQATQLLFLGVAEPFRKDANFF